MAANITKAYLLYVPIEKDYAHTLYFPNAAAQQAYFTGRKKFEATGLSYQRKDGVIRFPAQMDAILDAGCNYVMYQNAAYSDRWFYAFITGMSFENPQHTNITIATDCIQTWMFDITVKTSFVEREHATSDNVGEHTIDEALELGEYVCNDLSIDNNLTSCYYVILTTFNPTGDDKPMAVNMGGIFYAGGAYICSTMDEVVNIVQLFSKAGEADAVTAVYMVPKKIVINSSETLQFSGQANPAFYDVSKAKPTKINGYTPKNKKLLTYPFCYLLASNNAGSSNVYKYERFSTATCDFLVTGVPVVGGSIKSCPKQYNGISVNQEEGLMCGKFPTLSWSADLFTNWLTQNSVNIALGIGAGALQIAGGAVTMAATAGTGAAIGGAGIVGGVNSIVNTLAQVHQQSFTPNSARGNTNGGDINTANGANTFYYYAMSIKAEYAKAIDEFFTMYGYKCNRVKVPAKAHRSAFWFTKTIDAAIDGAIPQDDLQVIKDAYNKGITFWRPSAAIKNYNQDNAIV